MAGNSPFPTEIYIYTYDKYIYPCVVYIYIYRNLYICISTNAVEYESVYTGIRHIQFSSLNAFSRSSQRMFFLSLLLGDGKMRL